MVPNSKPSRREVLRLAGAVSLMGVAGCMGSGQNSGNGGGAQKGPAGTLGSWSFDVNSPKPVGERITGPEWTAPKYDKNAVANEISHFNMGSMKHDPASVWWHKYVEEKTGIKPKAVVIPSRNAVSKMTTLLSSGSKEPALLQLSQEFLMGFLQNGWLEPVDELWPDEAYEYFPPYYQTQLNTGLDVSLEGEHIYTSTAISEGHALNYNPSLLKDLGFPADFYTKSTWADVREICEEAKSQSKDYFGYVWYGKGNRYPAYPWLVHVWSYGGSIVQDDGKVVVNSKEGVKALAWQRQMIDDGLVPDVMQYGQGGPQDLFLGQRLIGFVGGTDMMALAFEQWGEDTNKYAMGLAPKGKNGERASYMNTDYLVINRNAPAKKKRAGMVYMDGARSAIASAYEWEKEGNFPSNAAAWELDILKDAKYRDIAQKLTKTTRVELWPHQIQTYSALITQLQKCWLGQKSPQTALDAAQKKIDNILNQN
jgi:multiple sugar transport system substrate-binding protein